MHIPSFRRLFQSLYTKEHTYGTCFADTANFTVYSNEITCSMLTFLCYEEFLVSTRISQQNMVVQNVYFSKLQYLNVHYFHPLLPFCGCSRPHTSHFILYHITPYFPFVIWKTILHESNLTRIFSEEFNDKIMLLSLTQPRLSVSNLIMKTRLLSLIQARVSE